MIVSMRKKVKPNLKVMKTAIMICTINRGTLITTLKNAYHSSELGIGTSVYLS